MDKDVTIGVCTHCSFENVPVKEYKLVRYTGFDAYHYDATLCDVCRLFYGYPYDDQTKNLATATNLILKAIRKHEQKHHGNQE